MSLRKFKGVNFHDDILTLNKKWFRDFLSKYSQQISLPFVCNLRIGNFTEEDVKLLKDANCESAVIGIESGNDYIRKNILNKGIESENIIKGFEILHKYGIKTMSQNMMGLPEETFESFYDTVRINAKIMPNRPIMSIFYPYPGTELYYKAIRDGLIEKNDSLLIGLDFVERENSILKLSGFVQPKIKFYAKYFRQMVFLEYIFEKINSGKKLRKKLYGNETLQKVIFGFLEMIIISLKMIFTLKRRIVAIFS